MKGRILLYGSMILIVLVAFVIGEMVNKSRIIKPFPVLVEDKGTTHGYRIVNAYHDQLQYDYDEERWYVRASDVSTWRVMVNVPNEILNHTRGWDVAQQQD